MIGPLPLKEICDALSSKATGKPCGFRIDATHMRTQEQVRCFKQRTGKRKRFLFKDVEAGGEKVSRMQGLAKGRFINNLSLIHI